MSDLGETIRGLLPHDSFEIVPRSATGGEVWMLLRCRCGRTLRWIGYLPSDVLIAWLADHDDDMFLTAPELEAKWNAVAPGLPGRDMLKMLKAPFTLPPMEAGDA